MPYPSVPDNAPKSLLQISALSRHLWRACAAAIALAVKIPSSKRLRSQQKRQHAGGGYEADEADTIVNIRVHHTG